MRGDNNNFTILPSAVRAAASNSQDQFNLDGRGLILVLDITVVPGVDTITPTIQGKDPASGKYFTILAGAAQVGVATVILRVYPGLVVAANLAANDILPVIWRLAMVHSAGSNFTYSVGASIVL